MTLVWHYLQYNLQNEDGSQFNGDPREGEALVAKKLDDDRVERGFSTLESFMRVRYNHDGTRPRRITNQEHRRQYTHRRTPQQQAKAARQRQRMEQRIRREQEDANFRRRQNTATGRPAGTAATAGRMRHAVVRRGVGVHRALIEQRKKELLELAARQHFNNNPIRLLDQSANIEWLNIKRRLEQQAFREVMAQFNAGNNPR